VSVSIAIYANQREKAEQAVLQNNTRALYSIVTSYSLNYSKDEWYGAWDVDGDWSLNNYIELEYETTPDGTYENKINLINPFSKKLSILDCERTYSSGDAYRPAAFLTATDSYSYTGSGSTNNLIGTIVVFFKVSEGTTEYIDFYYVNKDGSKSDFTRRLS